MYPACQNAIQMKYLYTVAAAMARESGPKIFKCMRLGMPSLSLTKLPWRAAVGTEHIRRSQGDCSCGYKQARSAPDALDERLRLQGGGSHLRFTRWQHCLCRAWIQPHGDGSASKAWREVFPPRCPRRSVWPIAAVIPRSRRYVRCRRRYGPNMVSDGG